jgi:HAD superfamily hydrolase (TIGR01549 family)
VTLTRGLFDTSVDLTSAAGMAAAVPRIEAVLFDFSNTIFRMVDMATWLHRVAAQTGRPLDAAEAVRELDKAITLPHVLAAQVGRDSSTEAHRRAMHAWFTEVSFLRGHEATAWERLTDADAWTPYVDTEPVLRELRRRGIPLGVVSDIGWDLRVHLAHYGLLDAFDTVALSCEMGVEKPDPRIFLKACADLGVDPRSTLMVGDNPVRDGGANAVGIRSFILSAEHRTGERGLSQVLSLLA